MNTGEVGIELYYTAHVGMGMDGVRAGGTL